MAHKRKVRLQQRRALLEGLVRRILLRVVSGDLEAREGYRQLRTIYMDERELMDDLKALVESVEGESSGQMAAAAREWLAQHPSVS